MLLMVVAAAAVRLVDGLLGEGEAVLEFVQLGLVEAYALLGLVMVIVGRHLVAATVGMLLLKLLLAVGKRGPLKARPIDDVAKWRMAGLLDRYGRLVLH